MPEQLAAKTVWTCDGTRAATPWRSTERTSDTSRAHEISNTRYANRRGVATCIRPHFRATRNETGLDMQSNARCDAASAHATH
eukprot:3196017-Lingulodinium_polyedra.AAC.1